MIEENSQYLHGVIEKERSPGMDPDTFHDAVIYDLLEGDAPTAK